MATQTTIRLAQADDAAAISRLVRHTLSVSNAADYPASEIERISRAFSDSAFAILMQRRRTFVACRDTDIVGTAGLEADTVRTVFVRPDLQGQGIGQQLMAMVEADALGLGLTRLEVQSSLTAVPFYLRCGFASVRDAHFGAERTVIMEKTVPASG